MPRSKRLSTSIGRTVSRLTMGFGFATLLCVDVAATSSCDRQASGLQLGTGFCFESDDRAEDVSAIESPLEFSMGTLKSKSKKLEP